MDPLLDLAARPIIAHRGASAEAPENTLEGFQLAVEQGAEAIELDVHVTADGVPVVLHDPTLDRTTDLAGPAAALRFAELGAADAGFRFSADGGRTFPWRGRGVRVPALAEVLGAFPRVPFLVEIKEPRDQAALRRVLLDLRAAERCLVASAEARALEAFRDPPFRLAGSRRDILRLWLRATLGLGPAPPAAGYRALSVPVRYRGLPVPTRRFTAAARGLGCPVHVWTVNDAAVARLLWEDGAAGMITDVPRALAAARAALTSPR